MPKALYILVADSGRAKIFESDSRLRSGIRLVHEEENPAGRKTRGELETDRPGQQRGTGAFPHAVGDDSAAERHESEKFARSLGKRLLKEHHEGKFEELMIAAPPQFLGDLRQNLSHECMSVLSKTVNKDLLRAGDRELISHLAPEV